MPIQQITSTDIANLPTSSVGATQLATGSVEGYLNTQGSAFGFRNRIINGAMVIDQRNAGASVTPTNGQYLLDRWAADVSQASKFTVIQSSIAPPGFSNSLLVTSSSAYTVGTNDYFALHHFVEGFNIADLNFGLASATPITLTFWVRSSLTGTFGGGLRGASNARSYGFTYTINLANTWEQKTVTVIGDTAGTWLTNNGVGIGLFFSLGVGSANSLTAGSWQSVNATSPTGAGSIVGTNGATWYVTGVQLEKGSTATSFDYRPYGTELALCQRYYQKSFPIGTAPAQNTGSFIGSMSYTSSVAGATGKGVFSYPFFVPMRTNATQTFYSPANASSNFWNRATGAVSGAVSIPYGETSAININAFNTQVAGDGAQQFIAVHWTCDAEL